MNWRQLPNLITGARIALTLPLVWLLRAGDYRTALAVAAIAAASDALDGFLAKQFHWQTRLGGLLDPIADKLLLAACFVGLWEADLVPAWLLWLVLGRDLVIVGGALAYQWLIGPVEARPTLASKLTTGVQIAFVLAGLLHLSGLPLPAGGLDGAALLVAALTGVSGLDYVLRWSWRARVEARRARLPDR